ncbi:hypothetical protein, unlikely [Trypanosoma congolense IL3000]|uniref:Uncharacterized protein n=1 Tax=Trypanosoma congolense (strain IL3000) TaxID=1068625 RepID=F9W7C3_TRYCI|nr:hypothetical protein, unlikely [Trypanosoma congolense IL3000]
MPSLLSSLSSLIPLSHPSILDRDSHVMVYHHLPQDHSLEHGKGCRGSTLRWCHLPRPRQPLLVPQTRVSRPHGGPRLFYPPRLCKEPSTLHTRSECVRRYMAVPSLSVVKFRQSATPLVKHFGPTQTWKKCTGIREKFTMTWTTCP